MVRTKDLETIPEDKWEAESQVILGRFLSRRLGVLVGQGALSFGVSEQGATEIVQIPRINVSAIMPNEVRVTLELKDEKELMMVWPEFHNGVAAGLKLSKNVFPKSNEHLRTWVFYQKPLTPKMEHAGLLLALGLQGQLDCFSPTDIYQYLKMSHEASSVAILLGISASRMGRAD